PHHIRVTSVAPGIIETPLHSQNNREFLKGLAPSGRIGQTQDITDAVLYLSRAEFTTGIVLPVDGGMSAGKW
ncbi:SDR family oxidoreductase, partial [Cellulomonas sp.]|uniref:SDR family oxidoreductase n=1 Tax=Cellulomonas sp. TaxID=40001 RepID=UPI001B0B61D1